MRVNVDRALCESNAICMSIAPEVFEVGEDDVLHILTGMEHQPERSPSPEVLVVGLERFDVGEDGVRRPPLLR